MIRMCARPRPASILPILARAILPAATVIPVHASARIRFKGYAYLTSGYILRRINKGNWETLGCYEHIQSVGRIAGLGDNEYFVFTHSTASDDPRKSGEPAVVRMRANNGE